MRASAQCVNAPIHMRAVRRFSTASAHVRNGEKGMKNVRAVRCLSALHGQTVENSFESRFRSPEAASMLMVARVYGSSYLRSWINLPLPSL